MAKDNHKRKDSKKSNKGSKAVEAITDDPRFSSVHNDPRFKLPNLNKLRVKVDERFSKEELSNFKKTKTKYDRYGRKLTEKDENSAFDKLYEQQQPETEEIGDSSSDESVADDDAAKVQPESSEDESVSESEVESDSTSGSEEDNAVTSVVDRARGGGLDSEDETSESDSDSDSSEEELEDEDSELEIEQGKPEEGEPERRFAVVNLDWDNVTSTDLFAAFTSFLPSKGSIKNISIYPSEYGKEKMQKEEVEGPPKDLFQSKSNKKKHDSDSDSDSDSDISDMEAAAKKLYEEGDGEKDYDSKALRRYQLQRLRYYYAVVTCDSISTAKSIYENCDGTEFESSANILDLRYIPEDMEFEDSARDTCNKIPANYKPNAFVTDALQSSKAKLTWDETPTERMKISTRAFSQREIEDMDFKAYLASDSEDENEEDLKNKYKSLVQSSTKVGDRSIFENESDKEDAVDMEITFTPGLADGVQPKEAKPSEESTIDAYRRKEKERRKKRMEKFKQAQKGGNNSEEDGTDDKIDTNEQSKKAKSKKAHRKDRDAEEGDNAELELLTMDNKDANHFNMRDVLKAEKEKTRKRHSKKKSKQIDREMVQDNFKPDLSDPRFKEIFENHDFAIDPTTPNFKKTETMKQILQERQKRRKNEDVQEELPHKSKKHQSNSSALPALAEKVAKKRKI